MELQINCFQPNLTSLPAWDYLLMLQYLEATYCFCLPAEDNLLSTNNCENDEDKGSQWLKTSKLSTSKKTTIRAKRKDDGSLSEEMLSKISRTKSSLHASDNEKDIPEHQEEAKNIKTLQKRRSRSTKLDIRKSLIRLRKRIMSKNTMKFTQTLKKNRGNPNKHLGRRSQYIGVTKNNTNWQALINVKGAKKYIGTFLHEVEAAKAYDLYSLAMQGKKASLNFNYTGKEMAKMISYFLVHGSIKPLE